MIDDRSRRSLKSRHLWRQMMINLVKVMSWSSKLYPHLLC
nr:MAG TPA: hypothetical protein [Caudoviricetes sp.]